MFTTLDQEIIIALLNHGHLDRTELTRILPHLPRGMPGHYILKDLEDNGFIKGRLPTRDTPLRIYQLEEKGRKAYRRELAGWPAA